jgi:hypothetical protein
VSRAVEILGVARVQRNRDDDSLQLTAYHRIGSKNQEDRMSVWDERIRANVIWQALETVGAVIDTASSKEGITAEAVDSLERLRAVLAFSGKRLAAVDPVLLEPSSLSKISAAWTAVQSELEAFSTDGAIAHLVTANESADVVLRALSAVLSPLTSDDLSTISESASAYRATLKRHLSESNRSNAILERTSTENLTKLAELAVEVAAERQKIATALTEHQSQFTVAQTTRASEFSTAQSERQVANAESNALLERSYAEAQSDRQSKHSVSVAEHQAQFTAAQEERARTDQEAQADRQTKFSTLMLDYAQKLSEQNTQFTSQAEAAKKQSQEELNQLKEAHEGSAQDILEQMNGHRRQIEKLVGVIGNLGVTSGYQVAANHARVALYVWQFLTVVALGGLISVAYIIAFTPNPAHGDFVQGFATRIFLTIAIGVFAAYSASQADKASIAERKNRKLALELEAVGPYIAPLPEEMQNKFRADLGERSFGVPDGDSRKAADASPATILDVLKSKELRELVDDALKRVLKEKN